MNQPKMLCLKQLNLNNHKLKIPNNNSNNNNNNNNKKINQKILNLIKKLLKYN